MSEFLFDSYAVMEIAKGNPNYTPYIDAMRILNDFILAEICYSFIKEGKEKLAFESTDSLKQFSLRVDSDTIKHAMVFRHANRKQKLSMTDCISYIQAQKLGIKFMTGDKQFEKLPGVEFVK